MTQDYDSNFASNQLSGTLLTAVTEFESLRRAECQALGIEPVKQQNKYLGCNQ